MGLYSNYNLNNFDLMGNNWQYGSGISGLFNGVPGMNTSVFNYGSYGAGNSTSGSNAALGWALGGVGVGVLGILATALISNSQSKKSEAAAEESAKESRYKTLETSISDNKVKLDEQLAILHDANGKACDVNSVNDYDVDQFVRAAETKFNDADIALGKAEIENKPAIDAYNKANEELNKLDTTDTNYKTMKKKVEDLKAPAVKADEAIRKANQAKVAAQKELENAEKEQPNLVKAKAEAIKIIAQIKKDEEEFNKIKEEKEADKLNSDINDVDGNAVGRLFAQKNATVDKSGNVELKDGQTKITEGDLRSILARYRKGDADVRNSIKSKLSGDNNIIDAIKDESWYKNYKSLVESIIEE